MSNETETSFRARERALLEQHALQVLADTKSSHVDRREARRRLEGERVLDLGRLTADELVLYEHMLARAAGLNVSAYDQICVEGAASAVADAARHAVDAEERRLAEFAGEPEIAAETE